VTMKIYAQPSGKLTDADTKILASNSARYKALGNSFETHCAMFVISGCVERIKMDGAKMKENK